MLISLDINNPIILKELEELGENEDKKEEYLKTILNIGSSILNSSTEIVNDCRLMGPFKELLKQCEDKINENIDDKLGSLVGKNSSMLGKFAENIYEKLLKRSFPEYTIINTATSGEKCGDIVIDTNSSLGKISIESKNYGTVVPKDQIDKFKRDLKNSGIQYGIMISVDSQITGKEDFEIEEFEDKYIIYIQNAGYDPIHLNLAIRYFMMFHELGVSKNNPMETPQTNREYLDKIDRIAETLKKNIKLERSLITDVDEAQTRVDNIMLKIKSSLYKMTAEKEVLLERMNEELDELKIEYSQDLNFNTFDDINFYVNEECLNKTRPKRILLMRAITIIHNNNFNFMLDKGIVSFYKEKRYCGKIDCNKGKQEIMIKEYGDEIKPYKKNMVIYKNDHYIFEIKDMKEVWLYLEEKLKM